MSITTFWQKIGGADVGDWQVTIRAIARGLLHSSSLDLTLQQRQGLVETLLDLSYDDDIEYPSSPSSLDELTVKTTTLRASNPQVFATPSPTKPRAESSTPLLDWALEVLIAYQQRPLQVMVCTITDGAPPQQLQTAARMIQEIEARGIIARWFATGNEAASNALEPFAAPHTYRPGGVDTFDGKVDGVRFYARTYARSTPEATMLNEAAASEVPFGFYRDQTNQEIDAIVLVDTAAMRTLDPQAVAESVAQMVTHFPCAWSAIGTTARPGPVLFGKTNRDDPSKLAESTSVVAVDRTLLLALGGPAADVATPGVVGLMYALAAYPGVVVSGPTRKPASTPDPAHERRRQILTDKIRWPARVEGISIITPIAPGYTKYFAEAGQSIIDQQIDRPVQWCLQLDGVLIPQERHEMNRIIEMVRSAGIEVSYGEHGFQAGDNATRNEALKRARHSVTMGLDADDTLAPTALRIVLHEMNANPRAGCMVAHRHEWFPNPQGIYDPINWDRSPNLNGHKPGSIDHRLASTPHLTPDDEWAGNDSPIIIRTDLMRALGGWNAQLRDGDLSLLGGAIGTMEEVEKVIQSEMIVASWRRHPDQQTQTIKRTLRGRDAIGARGIFVALADIAQHVEGPINGGTPTFAPS